MAEKLTLEENMSEQNEKQNPDHEINAISVVYKALSTVDSQAQKRVLEYVAKMLNIITEQPKDFSSSHAEDAQESASTETIVSQSDDDASNETGDGLDGISPVAQKWMRRNGLQANQLSSIFSLGVDEIDLVAKTVPEKSKRARMLNVFLLKGVAAYLSSGVPRFTHNQAKETCSHYDAYDSANFAKHLKEFAAEISGTKESGYTLTARGLTHATDLLKKMVAEK